MERNSIQAVLVLLLGACAWSAPGAAAAEETKVLYKCVDATGVVSIQAKPCPKGSTEAWKRAAQTVPKPTQAEIAEQQAREARNREAVVSETAELQRKLAAQAAPQPPASAPAGSHLAGANNPKEGSHMAPVAPNTAEDVPLPQSVSVNNCQAAQAFAAGVREKTWIGLTDDQMRRIFGWVSDQCRVSTATDD